MTTGISKERLRKMKKLGLSDSAAADRIGTSTRAVKRARYEYGIEPAIEGSDKHKGTGHDDRATSAQLVSDSLIDRLYAGRSYDDVKLKQRRSTQ